MKAQVYAVITGDVISSSTIIGNYHDVLRQIGHDIKAHLDHRFIMDIYRGDSFQMISACPEKGLLMMLIIKAGLRSYKNEKGGLEEQWDARIALGIGKMDKYPRKHTLGEVSGEPFLRSGHALDQMKGEGDQLKIVTGDNRNDQEFEAVTPLIEAITSRWTTAQSEAVYLSLLRQSITQFEMGQELGGISQRAVGKRLEAAHFVSLKKYLNRFESINTWNSTQ